MRLETRDQLAAIRTQIGAVEVDTLMTDEEAIVDTLSHVADFTMRMSTAVARLEETVQLLSLKMPADDRPRMGDAGLI